ncbi:cytochrome P450 [Nocardia sp. alder85J]|uniref:cytochrome P450 n=1 Tax=Nocardia sp. alder85J TaxID=2862949 RepID=UPI001CD4C80C|nr:cytochrome P450 [Nocardia sp. alder85J]MCX4093115.1 cytochrome P450 [Nocardia sp. alder85J]
MTSTVGNENSATRILFPDTADQREFEAVCHELRERAPVVCLELPDGLTAWVITRYAEGRRAMTDPRLIKDLRRMSDPAHGLGGGRYAEDPFVVEGRHMLNSDGEEHLRLRKVVAAELTPAAVNRRRPEIEQVCRAQVARFRESETTDLMASYARPVPELVMARVLGIPDDTLRAAAVHSRRLGERESPSTPSMRNAYNQLLDMIIDVARDPAAAPAGSVLEALHRARAEKMINKRELLSTVMMLLGAGISSTAIGIGYGALTVLRTAETMRELLADEPAAKAFVEELLRYHPPFPFSPWRFAREEVTIEGVTIPAGAVVFILLAAVNHDPALGADVGELLPQQGGRPAHLTFGYGAHFCIGAHLARTEIEIALRVLFEELPQLRIVSDDTESGWRGLLFDRTPNELTVAPGPGAR